MLSPWKKLYPGVFNPLTTSVPYHIETSQLICIANQYIGFYVVAMVVNGLRPYQTSMIRRFYENRRQLPLYPMKTSENLFSWVYVERESRKLLSGKSFITDAWQSSKYASAFFWKIYTWKIFTDFTRQILSSKISYPPKIFETTFQGIIVPMSFVVPNLSSFWLILLCLKICYEGNLEPPKFFSVKSW